MNILYDYPEYYDVAFSFRNYAREAAFLSECIRVYSDIPVNAVLEIGCGPAPHAGALAALGYQYVGLDINRNMLDYAAGRWRSLQPRPALVEGDMRGFVLPVPIQFAFVMLGSLYVNSREELTRHFNSMAAVLPSGGLYFLDWCIQFGDPLHHAHNNRFAIDRNGISVESRFNIRLLDPAEQMYEEIWSVDVNDRGLLRTFSMVERNRALLPEEFKHFLAERGDFELIGWWRDWDLTQEIDPHEPVIRPVALVRRS